MEKDIHDYLMNAKSVKFWKINKTENVVIPTVFVLFEDVNTGIALYTEVVRVNKDKPQFLGFKKSGSSLILSIMLEATGRSHCKMLLDYNEKEFDEFISVVKPTDAYMFIFGKIVNGKNQIGGFNESPVVFNKYILE